MLLYIDPGTGSMLFTVVMCMVTTLIFSLQKVWLKLKFIFSSGKSNTKKLEKMGIVIFSDNKRYWNVFKSICDEFERRKMECHFWTASPDDPALDEPYEYVKCEFIGEGNKAFAKLNMMKADICLSTTPGLDVYQWKRSKNVGCYIHIPHEIGEMTGYRMFGIDYYDAVLLTGEFQEKDLRTLEEMRGTKHKEMFVVGSTTMDALLEKVKGCNVEPQEITTILLAPSWGESSILNRYGEKFLQALKETGHKIIVRPHPQSKISDPDMLKYLQTLFPNNDRWEWNFDNDNFDVLSRSDLMISDFSGVIFDFALGFEKTVIYADTHLDRAPYDSCWIDEEPWRLHILPTIGRKLDEKDFQNIRQVIEEALSDESYSIGRENLKNMAWMYQGESARKVVDYLADRLEKIEGNNRQNGVTL
jgi:hypothetical protein